MSSDDIKNNKKKASRAIMSGAIAATIAIVAAIILINPFASSVPEYETVASETQSAVSLESETDVSETQGAMNLETASVGDIIHLGEFSFMAYNAGNELRQNNDYAWLVLAVENNKVLLVANDVIDKRQYNAKHTETTWENCSLRQWLNGDFYECLPSNVKTRIVETDLVNSDNKEFNVPGGNNTKDRVFLLSIDEVHIYLTSDEQRQATLKMHGDTEDRVLWRWWLRSPGNSSVNAALIGRTILIDDKGGNESGSDGSIISGGEGVNRNIGVRPAFWIER